MLTKIKSLLYATLVAFVLFSCAGEDGEVGPAGPQGEKGDAGENGEQGEQGEQGDQGAPAVDSLKIGFSEGTITGTMRDGTPFTETFRFEYATGLEQVFENSFVAHRFEDMTGALMSRAVGADLVDRGFVEIELQSLDNDMIANNNKFNYVKELNSSTVFKLRAYTHTVDETYNTLLELKREYQGVYQLETNVGTGSVVYFPSDTDSDGIDDVNMVVQGGGLLHYDITTGLLTGIEEEGTISTSGSKFDKYDDIKFVYNDDQRAYVFENVATGQPMWEYVGDVPADVATITNYTSNDGVVSFDYDISVSKYRGYLGQPIFGTWYVQGKNTTYHDLRITGTFNSGGKVYTNEVGRTKR